MTDHESLVRRSLAGTDAFDERVRAQADRLTAALADGAFDNEAATLGLELEVYALDGEGEDRTLAPIPDDVYDGPADKELGLHNAELNAAPSRFDDDGVAAQAAEIESDLAATRERAREHGLEIVLDAMPAVPPAEGTHAYLDDVEVRGGDGADRGDSATDAERPVVVPGGDPDDPVLVARNMRRDPRYGALDNVAVRRAGGEIDFSVPGAETGYRTILFESLATSIQPHVQVPDPTAFPRYHNLATRTLGPLVALAANSPFLPGDCYGDVDDPERLVDETHHELRIAAFEQSMNQGCRKVRVPDDLDEPAGALEHVVADDSFAPFLQEWIEGEARSASDSASGASRRRARRAATRPVRPGSSTTSGAPSGGGCAAWPAAPPSTAPATSARCGSSTARSPPSRPSATSSACRCSRRASWKGSSLPTTRSGTFPGRTPSGASTPPSRTASTPTWRG